MICPKLLHFFISLLGYLAASVSCLTLSSLLLLRTPMQIAKPPQSRIWKGSKQQKLKKKRNYVKLSANKESIFFIYNHSFSITILLVKTSASYCIKKCSDSCHVSKRMLWLIYNCVNETMHKDITIFGKMGIFKTIKMKSIYMNIIILFSYYHFILGWEKERMEKKMAF